MRRFLASTSLCACVVLGTSALLWASAAETYKGMCDGSAGVAITPDLFVVANDDGQTLRVYRRGTPEPLKEFDTDLNSFLGTDDANNQEADIEAVARVKGRAYWMTSHGRDSDAVEHETRRRFFATELKLTGDKVTIEPVQRPYTRLLDDLFNAESLRHYTSLLRHGATLAPEAKGGLNIEGLAATPEGQLLIGFRNPILPNGSALVVPLLNPEDVVNGQTARFGDPRELKLGGLGIRSIDYVAARQSYWIIAGPSGDEGEFKLFEWSGSGDPAPRTDVTFDHQMHPEALVTFPDNQSNVLVLMDDGDIRGMDPSSNKKCKNVAQDLKRFRAISVPLVP